MADARLLAGLPQVVIDAVNWIFADDVADRPLPGWVSAAWLVGVTIVLAGWLLRRTRQLVGE